MAANWDRRTTFGIINTQAGGLTCVATIKSGGRRCMKRLNPDNIDRILSRIDNLPETAPVNLGTEAATLRRLALGSFCWHHNDEAHVTNAVWEWQRALTAERAALAIIRRLQSQGIGDVDNPEDDKTDSDISSTDSNDSDGESDDDHSSDGDDTTSTTISTGSDSNPKPNESPETERLREELAHVVPEVEALRAQIERDTPELDELRQRVARATPEAEVEDLRSQLERATLERQHINSESEQVRRESAQFRLENRRLRRTFDRVRRITTGLNAEIEVQGRQSEPLGTQSEQSEESELRSEEAEPSSGASPSGGEGESREARF